MVTATVNGKVEAHWRRSKHGENECEEEDKTEGLEDDAPVSFRDGIRVRDMSLALLDFYGPGIFGWAVDAWHD